jgi:hypothetical protein
MISSSSPLLERWVDTMVLVYSLLQPKGLPRVLRRVHKWLGQSHPKAAQDFWSQTGGGSHLP